MTTTTTTTTTLASITPIDLEDGSKLKSSTGGDEQNNQKTNRIQKSYNMASSSS
jgi:hypothetical protein